MQNESVKRHQEMQSLMKILRDDLMYCEKLIKQEDNMVTRRVYIKSSISYVESFLFAVKSSIIDVYENEGEHILPAELAILKEESYGCDQNVWIAHAA